MFVEKMLNGQEPKNTAKRMQNLTRLRVAIGEICGRGLQVGRSELQRECVRLQCSYYQKPLTLHAIPTMNFVEERILKC